MAARYDICIYPKSGHRFTDGVCRFMPIAAVSSSSNSSNQMALLFNYLVGAAE